MMDPMPALVPSKPLWLAAKDHVEDGCSSGKIDHIGSDGSTVGGRIARYGKANAIWECIALGADPEYMVTALLDDGHIPDRGHRRIMLNSKNKFIGVGYRLYPKEKNWTAYYSVWDFSYDIQELQISSAASQSQTSFGTAVKTMAYLSELERQVVIEINRARTNPNGYAAYVKNLKKYFDGNLLKFPGEIALQTSEGPSALDECYEALMAADPLDSLRPSKGMSRAAKDHAEDQGETSSTGHTGRDGSSPFDRLTRYGEWQKTAGENIDYGNNDARRIVSNGRQDAIDNRVEHPGIRHDAEIQDGEQEHRGHAGHALDSMQHEAGSLQSEPAHERGSDRDGDQGGQRRHLPAEDDG